MSVQVELSELVAAMGDHDFAYLLTVSDEGRSHAVAVVPEVADGELRLGGLGRRSIGNAGARPDVSMVFPPRELGGYSLIVDGDAALDGETVVVVPSHAVRHRPAPPAGEAPSGACGSDCEPVDLGAV